nr:putative N-acetyltransferase [Raoultella sp. NCTC 9187]
MNIFQAQPQDVDKILPLYLGYRNFYQVEAQPIQAREFILKRLELNESVYFFRGS